MEYPLITEKPIPRLLKAHEVAQILNISRSLSYRLMQSGAIPAIRIRNSVRVSQVDLDKYISTLKSILPGE